MLSIDRQHTLVTVKNWHNLPLNVILRRRLTQLVSAKHSEPSRQVYISRSHHVFMNSVTQLHSV